jgi:uncharacterized protein YcbK (DUF882 family)
MTIRLTANISREEVACRCGCGFNIAEYALMVAVQDSADFFKHKNKSDRVRILVKSGNRCKAHNEKVQKKFNKHYIPFSSKSQHIYGKAMDYMVETWDGMKWNRVSTPDLASYLDKKYPGTYGIGKYWSGRVHLDVRPDKARWQS